uniref:Uncharacterized protein n=1 Tax=Arundo donax TaxID=35708 RepID=A0A0A8Z5R8_ARUDO
MQLVLELLDHALVAVVTRPLIDVYPQMQTQTEIKPFTSRPKVLFFFLLRLKAN